MADRRRRRIALLLFGNAKIDQHRFVERKGDNHISWLDITMHNRRTLLVQVGNGLRDGGKHRQYLSKGEPLIRLLPAQHFQIWPLDIIHQNISTGLLLVLKGAVDARQCRVVEPLENLAFKDEAFSLRAARRDRFFEGVKISAHARIPHKIDRAKTALAEQALYHIAVVDNGPVGENCLYLLHASYLKTQDAFS